MFRWVWWECSAPSSEKEWNYCKREGVMSRSTSSTLHQRITTRPVGLIRPENGQRVSLAFLVRLPHWRSITSSSMVTRTSTLKVEGTLNVVQLICRHRWAKAATSKKRVENRKKPNYGASGTAVSGIANNPSSGRTSTQYNYSRAKKSALWMSVIHGLLCYNWTLIITKWVQSLSLLNRPLPSKFPGIKNV